MTEWYAGTGGNDSTGDGTSYATRWLTIQKFIDAGTTGQANRLNVSGSETLSASLDFTTRPMTLTQDNFLLIEGITDTADDGGIFALDGGANEIINDDNLDAIFLSRCKFTNWGTGTAFSLDNWCGFSECEFDGEGSRTHIIDSDIQLSIVNCKIHGLASTGTVLTIAGLCYGNYFQMDSMTTTDYIINLASSGAAAINNVISMKTTSSGVVGIRLGGDDHSAIGNTVFNQSVGTGVGIQNSNEGASILNNIVCGCGTGIEAAVGSTLRMYGGNKLWNNTTNETLNNHVIFDLGGNEVLGGNPFTSTGNADPDDDDFTVDTSVKGLAYPSQLWNPGNAFGTRNKQYLDAGALQREEAGGLSFINSRRSTLIGR